MASVRRKVRKEVVSAVSAATELVAEAVSIVQKLVQVHRTVRGLPAVLDRHRSQLTRIQHVLETIQAEPYLLGNQAVMEHVEEVHAICKEVEEQIELRERQMRVGMKGGKAGRYLRVLLEGGRLEREMSERLERVGSSLALLDTVIDVAQVEILRRVEESVAKTGLNAGDRIVDSLGEQPSINANTTTTWTAEGGSTITAVDEIPLPHSTSSSISSDATTTTTFEGGDTIIAIDELPLPHAASPSSSDLPYFENTSQGHAIQFNGDVGSTDWGWPARCEYTRMQAKDYSVQVNGRTDFTALQAILAMRG
ncbi:hypothetical protein N656DRAFT_796927 [Canariomyces notabilis]|uniref:Uncharacterized protein n=1 Tax=Canariomyces notabilis TaxID=2074819 RepID=A0AAN6YU78_9PEZI|nr:hypothetical protein N656DRAFT_796927 [Canariomyces arenarius]